jgi:hypothetical protein
MKQESCKDMKLRGNFNEKGGHPERVMKCSQSLRKEAASYVKVGNVSYVVRTKDAVNESWTG